MTEHNPAPVKRRTLLRGFSLIALLVLGLLGIGVADAWRALGTLPEGERLERIRRSPQYREGKFVDTLPRTETGKLQRFKLRQREFERTRAG